MIAGLEVITAGQCFIDTIDLSVWMYNKKLFKQAGLDPEKPPKSLTEFAADARAVAKLGGDVHGTFFGGDCGGCGLFTWWPIAWADGRKVMNPEGTELYLNSAENKAIYATFRGMVDDEPVRLVTEKGYAPTPAERLYAHPNVGMDVGRVALRRGPLIYCVEEADNPGPSVQTLALPRAAAFEATWRDDLFGGVMTLTAKAMRLVPGDAEGKLYSTTPPAGREVRLTALPYHLWANREPGVGRGGDRLKLRRAPRRRQSAGS